MRRSRFLLSALALSVLVSGRAMAQDPLKVASDMYKLKFENDRVRVMEVVFKPGAKVATHSHPDHMGYAITAGKLKISRPNAAATEAELKAGDVLWIPAETHWAENVGTTELRVLVTELKEAAPAKPAPEKTK